MNEKLSFDESVSDKVSELCDIVYHSAMGDGWHLFVVARAEKIVDQIIASAPRQPIFEGHSSIDFWDAVKKDIQTLKK